MHFLVDWWLYNNHDEEDGDDNHDDEGEEEEVMMMNMETTNFIVTKVEKLRKELEGKNVTEGKLEVIFMCCFLCWSSVNKSLTMFPKHILSLLYHIIVAIFPIIIIIVPTHRVRRNRETRWKRM